MWKLFKIDQDDNAASDGAGGGEASQAGAEGAGAGDAGAAAAAAAQGGAGGGTSNSAGNDGKTGQKPAWEKDTIVWNGQEKEMTRQEIIDYAQKAFNVTQREQAASKKWKEATAQLTRLEQLISETEKGRKQPDGEGGEAPDPMKMMGEQLQQLQDREKVRQWKEIFHPISQKYPDVDDKDLADRFIAKKAAGEAEDTEAGLMAVAKEMQEEAVQQKTVRENKQITELLAKPDDPRLKAYNEKLLADYRAGKLKLANAGGEHGAGGAGAGTKDDSESSISDIAAKIRAGI